MKLMTYYCPLINTVKRLQQTHTRAQEELEFKFTQPMGTFSILPANSIERSWKVGLRRFEPYFFDFIKTEKKIRIFHRSL